MAVESRRSFDDRLSQASTAYFRSNESSISLMSRRPSHLIRSNTAPGLSMRRSGHGYRQGILEALQNSDIPDQIHDTAPEASSSLGTGDSEVGETAAIAAIGSGEASHGSNR